MPVVRVSSPTYVNTGFIDLHGGLGRLYGSIGFSLEEPRCIVEARPRRGGVDVEAPGWDGWAEEYAGEACRLYRCGGVRLRVATPPPAQAPLCSRLTLALSIAMAVALTARRRFKPGEAVLMAGGGPEAGLALYSFTHGGFIVDGGLSDEGEVPPLIFRAIVPPTWRILLASTRGGGRQPSPSPGIAGEGEAAANSRLLVMGVMPGAANAYWDRVAPLLERVNESTLNALGWRGAREVMEALKRAGAPCACQSPTSPVVFAIVREEDPARIKARLSRELEELGVEALWATRVDNRGAYATPLQ